MSTDPITERTTFRDVKAEILRRITDGLWGPGTLLPGEVDLAEEFGCSRTTINRAMREISDQGLLDRRRKAGTRVRMAPLRQARFEMPVVRTEIENTGATYRYALVKRETLPAPDWLRAKMNLPAGGLVVHLICMHYANGAAFQLEDRWINATALPLVLEQDFTTIGPNEWLIASVPFSEVEISFEAIAADPLIAAHLDHQLGEPVFRVERATWWQSAAITHVRLSYRKNYRMTTRY
jgi:GntR family transcriptional regulator, histidine utilization repressor